MSVSERTEIVAVETATSFLQWTPVIAGALVASALSLVLIAFGSAIGLSILSSSPTWRDASPALAVVSGLFLLLTAIASFGLGGYVAGRLRERWHQSAHSDVVEFRDGTHGVVTWALAVVITGLVAAISASVIASRAVQPATSPAATTGEPLIAYELDRLFRAGQRPFEGDVLHPRRSRTRPPCGNGAARYRAGGPSLFGAAGRGQNRYFAARCRTPGRRRDCRGNHGRAEGAPQRCDSCLRHGRLTIGRGRGGVVRVMRWRAASRQRRSVAHMATTATRLGVQRSSSVENLSCARNARHRQSRRSCRRASET